MAGAQPRWPSALVSGAVQVWIAGFALFVYVAVWRVHSLLERQVAADTHLLALREGVPAGERPRQAPVSRTPDVGASGGRPHAD